MNLLARMGERTEDNMDRKSSLQELEQQAERDGSLACELGDRYRQGKGVPQDEALAFQWYSRGAALGDRDAQNNLGTMFLHGIGCQADKEQAIYWYRQSAEQGNADAQWNLAKRYLHGDGINQNYAEAYRWFSEAVAQGYTEALCEMGTMHQCGHGVESNLLAAADFHLIAAEKGDFLACDHLREYYAELQNIALSGNQMASLFLCRMYNRGLGVEKSQALTWTWILWARKNCQPDDDAEIVAEVAEAYQFYQKYITPAHRKEGKRVLATLREEYSQWADTPEGSARIRQELAKGSAPKVKKNKSKPKAQAPSLRREGDSGWEQEGNDAALARWLGAKDNPVGIDILDCHTFAMTMMSTTSDERIAMRFSQLRSSLGSEMAGSSPERARSIPCSLDFPLRSPLAEGPVFKAEVMEDKWDIYLFTGHLYFCRSWTGELLFRASVTFSDNRMVVTDIETNSSEENDLVIRQVAFLIWSHVLHRLVLHPLPTRLGTDPEALTAHSFSVFGRWGWYGTVEDTLKLSPEQQAAVESLSNLSE